MPFLSYAQNFEDVLLWRAVGHVENGAYIDIGAQHPIVDSVSKGFHLRGWRGVHVEPNEVYAEALRADRPGDTVIQAALGTAVGPIRFFYIPSTGLSTGIASIAEEHRCAGFEVREIQVPVLALADVLKPLSHDGVHWMKIDVEGMEADVLRSWGASAVRPWILVIEATHPNTQIPTEHAWIDIVRGLGYHEVHFDGLSRYFVSNLHPELDPAFATPPNIFDGFLVAGHHFTARQIQAEHAVQIAQLTAAVGAAEREALEAEAKSAELESARDAWVAERKALEASTVAAAVNAEITVTTLAARTAQWEREASDLKAEIERAARETTRLREMLRSARAALMAERERNQTTEADFRAGLDRARRDLVDAAAREASTSSERRALANALAEAEQQHAALRAELGRFRHALEDRERGWVAERADLEAVLATVSRERGECELRLQEAQKREAQTISRSDAQRIACEAARARAESAQRHAERAAESATRVASALSNDLATARQAAVEMALWSDVVLTTLRTRRARGIAGILRRAAALLRLYDSGAWERGLPPLPFGDPVWKGAQGAAPDDVEVGNWCGPDDELTISVPSSVQSLLELSGTKFVHCAYRMVLGRVPDEAGRTYYLRRLHEGWPKMSVLGQLRRSREGRNYGAEIDGLDAMIRRYRRSRLPIVGPLFRHTYRTEAGYAFDSEETAASFVSVPGASATGWIDERGAYAVLARCERFSREALDAIRLAQSQSHERASPPIEPLEPDPYGAARLAAQLNSLTTAVTRVERMIRDAEPFRATRLTVEEILSLSEHNPRENTPE